MIKIIEETYGEVRGPHNSYKYKYIAILKMDSFYMVLIWTKFVNFTSGSIEVIDCDNDLEKAIREYTLKGGVYCGNES